MYPTPSVGKGLKMLLTYGNIKKSKFLKYIYLSDYNDDEYRKALLEYNKSIVKDFENSDFIKIYKYLHDAKIYLKQINGDVVIKVNTDDSEENKNYGAMRMQIALEQRGIKRSLSTVRRAMARGNLLHEDRRSPDGYEP